MKINILLFSLIASALTILYFIKEKNETFVSADQIYQDFSYQLSSTQIQRLQKWQVLSNDQWPDMKNYFEPASFSHEYHHVIFRWSQMAQASGRAYLLIEKGAIKKIYYLEDHEVNEGIFLSEHQANEMRFREFIQFLMKEFGK